MNIDKLALEKALYRKSYYHFFKEAYKVLLPSDPLVDNWHILELCNVMQSECERICRNDHKTRDYIINIPPRTSKSLICSIVFPVWCWIKDPSLVLMTLSYSDEVSTDNSYQSKLLIKSAWFQSLFGNEFQIRYDSNAKSDYINDKGGRRMALGITGSITSKGAHIIILDDPQNPKRADSDVERLNVINLYDKTIYNRYKNPNTIVRFIIQQRLHEEDLSGYLLKSNKDKYYHINLPATLSKDVSPYQMSERYVTGYLDPVRLNESILQDLRKQGSRYYSSQYQQNPIPSDGEIVKSAWLKTITMSEFNQMVMSRSTYDKYNKLDTFVTLTWDFFADTAEGVATGDAHAVLCACNFENKLYVKKVYTSREEIPDLIRSLIRLVQLEGSENSRLFVEPKSTGRTIVQTISRESRINVIMNEPPKDSKKARLLAITPKLESLKVVLIEDTWNESFITELIGFPNMKHDDQVDVLEMAVRKLLTNSYQNNFMF